MLMLNDVMSSSAIGKWAGGTILWVTGDRDGDVSEDGCDSWLTRFGLRYCQRGVWIWIETEN
jgi:hypothetical protein